MVPLFALVKGRLGALGHMSWPRDDPSQGILFGDSLNLLLSTEASKIYFSLVAALLIPFTIQGEGYLAFAPANITTTLFTNLDEDSHARYKRPVANAYSLSALKLYEPNVDRVIGELVSALSEKAAKSEVVNLSLWCHYCRSFFIPIDYSSPRYSSRTDIKR